MNDPVRTDRDRTSAAGSSRRSASLLRRLAGQILDQGSKPGSPADVQKTPGIRIDQSHARPGGVTAAPIPLEDEDLEDRSTATAAAGPASPSRSSRREEEVLRQTTQIAAHLRSEREELERREKASTSSTPCSIKSGAVPGCGSTSLKRTSSNGSPTSKPGKTT